MTSFPRLAAAAGVVVLALTALTSCDGGGGAGDAAASRAPAIAAAATADLLWTSAMVRQGSPAEEPVLCIGGILQSNPPQCAGHVGLVGWDWDAVMNETVRNSVTWIDTVYVTGTFSDGTFTLKRPPSPFPPAGAAVEAPTAGKPFPQLCDDPLRGAAESASSGVRADTRARDALSRHLETMDGYVASWVSDRRGALMNVVVTGNPQRAHATARTLWSGKLCVDQRDVATYADMLSAQKALMSATWPAHQCVGGGPSSQGQLGVGVTLADPETVAEIHRLVAPWLSPDDVVIHSRLRPLTG